MAWLGSHHYIINISDRQLHDTKKIQKDKCQYERRGFPEYQSLGGLYGANYCIEPIFHQSQL